VWGVRASQRKGSGNGASDLGAFVVSFPLSSLTPPPFSFFLMGFSPVKTVVPFQTLSFSASSFSFLFFCGKWVVGGRKRKGGRVAIFSCREVSQKSQQHKKTTTENHLVIGSKGSLCGDPSLCVLVVLYGGWEEGDWRKKQHW
jgi:hypothetical protein